MKEREDNLNPPKEDWRWRYSTWRRRMAERDELKIENLFKRKQEKDDIRFWIEDGKTLIIENKTNEPRLGFEEKRHDRNRTKTG